MRLLSIIFPAGVFYIIRRPAFGTVALILQATVLLWPLAILLAFAGLSQHNSELAQAHNFTFRRM